MSVMERRLQLLLDADRYDLVQAEATSSGRSVAAVIREAIDFRFQGAAQRSDALAVFLELTEQPSGPALGWADIKAGIEDDLDRSGRA